MPELTSKDCLQPSLLDRLTDRDPIARTESRDARVLSRRQLRQSVRRDLMWLFNSMRPQGGIDPVSAPLAAASVLNFGLPNWTGLTVSGLSPARIAEDIAEAIRRFEPRILTDSLRVTPLPKQIGHGHPTLPFLIEGLLWAQPYPEPLYYHAELDLEDSEFRLSDTGRNA